MLTYTYHDKILKSHVKPELEARALAEITEVSASFTPTWLQLLVPYKAYTLLCRESTMATDDVFAQKLAAYERVYAETLKRALDATDDAEGIPLSAIVGALERA